MDGIIRPEIRFQVNLSTQWNGRFYMSGNGAFAGTQSGTRRSGTRDTNYYDDVIKTMNGNAQDTYRLFMVPGMGYCGGGVGASKIDTKSSIIDWVESHKTPTQLVATGGGADGKGSVLMCPYPQAAKYKGSGDAMDQANWTCGN
ncbi:MAG: tannase/feruloyl esterase family alpha/beta hydrolase [Rhizobiaceae bacterium]|nr:tannase/feruloyl esterase family alpha/beta hydrolase [Rhizobiaceae bacterium]